MELEEKPTLFVEIQGSALGVREQIEIFGEIAETNNVLKFDWSDQPETINKLWSARHAAYYAALALDPGKKGFPTDVCVPISRLTECILETKKDLEESEILFEKQFGFRKYHSTNIALISIVEKIRKIWMINYISVTFL